MLPTARTRTSQMSSTAPVADVRAISRAAAPISQAGELRSSRIESLRAVAALGVLVGHTFAIARAYHGTYNGLRNQLISGGLLAVFLFFTLSGYLLYWPFVEMLRQWLGIDEGEPGVAVRTRLRARLAPLFPAGLDDVLQAFGNLLSVRLDVQPVHLPRDGAGWDKL